jgi:hypothetical protein
VSDADFKTNKALEWICANMFGGDFGLAGPIDW